MACAIVGSETLGLWHRGLDAWRFTFDVAASGADNAAFGDTAGFGAPEFGVLVGGEAIMARASRHQRMSRNRDLAVI